jgi:2-oxoglutarate ferredoxin oxidoreductase subunit alpha
MPTKTEQADLFQAIWGRNSDAPVCVLAPKSPGDCFIIAIEAVRIATKYMTPVIVLSDGFIANGAEPWAIPKLADLPEIEVTFREDATDWHPYQRDPETLARGWAIPGTPGLEHRIGGLEKSFETGHISYDPLNHHKMTKVREQKILNIAKDIPEQEVELGESSGKLAMVSWGSTYGAVNAAVQRSRAAGLPVSHIHLRYMWPMPRNLGELLRGFDKVVVPELNNGQLVRLLRSEYLVPAQPLCKIHGQPFRVAELVRAIGEHLEDKRAD